MTQQHLKPDEIAMLQRAEKATKGLWKPPLLIETDEGDGTVYLSDNDGKFIADAEKYLEYNLCGEDDERDLLEALRDSVNARTDLPTILNRLANERAKLAIANALMERAAREFLLLQHAFGVGDSRRDRAKALAAEIMAAIGKQS